MRVHTMQYCPPPPRQVLRSTVRGKWKLPSPGAPGEGLGERVLKYKLFNRG